MKTASGLPSLPLTARRRIGVDRDEAVGLAQIRPLRPVIIVLPGIFEVDRDVAAIVGEVPAGKGAHIISAGVAIFADARLAADLHAVIVALQDEVDDARNGVGAVDRRIAAGDDVDPLDEIGRDRIHVGRVGVEQDVAGNVAASVDQNERALRAEAAKIEQVQAGGAQELGRVGLAERAAQRRKVVQSVAEKNIRRPILRMCEVLKWSPRPRRSRR